MDKKHAIEIAQKYVRSVGAKYEISQAILFGSYAKGVATESSDIDIALVFKNVKDVIDRQIELMKLRRKVDLRIEPHAFRMKDFVDENPLAHEILKYGILMN